MAETGQSPAETEIDLGALLALFWAERLRILACALAGALLAAGYLLSTPRIYEADALLQLEQSSSGLEGIGSLFADEPQSLAEIEIFRSRRVLGSVVDELDLTLRAEPRRLPVLFELPGLSGLAAPGWGLLSPFAWGDAGITVGVFELPEEMRGQALRIEITAPGRYRLHLPGGATLDGAEGVTETLHDPRMELRIDRIEGPPGRQFLLSRRTRLEAITALRDALSIAELGRGTEILRVAYRDTEPDRAESVLEALTHAYFAQNLSRNTAEVEQSLQFVEAQLPEARAELDDAQARLNRYRQEQKSVDLAIETSGLLRRAAELREKLSELELREQDIQQRFRESHPVYQRLLASRMELDRQLSAVLAETGGLPETQKEIFNLSQDLDVAREIYFQLVNTAQQLRLARASSIGNVRILDRAEASPDPVLPRAGLVLVLGLAGGLAAGIGLALLMQVMRRKVDDISDIEETGLPVYGVIARVPGLGRQRPRRGERMKLITETEGAATQLEALRSLRTGLHFGLIDKSPQAIAITSAAPGDGKSFTAANLASIAAMSQGPVCLVDADLRRGYLDRYFGVARSPGLSDYLAGKAELDEILHPVGAQGLHFIASGKYPPNPAELIMGPKFARLVEELGRRFALTVYDAPPVLAVTDPTIIARQVPVTLAVIRHRATDLAALRAMQRSFARAGQEIGGVILNDYQPARARAGSGVQHYAYDYAPRPE